MKCVKCNEEAEYIFDGMSLCQKHIIIYLDIKKSAVTNLNKILDNPSKKIKKLLKAMGVK